MIDNLIIKNGKLNSISSDYDFHVFVEDSLITVYLILPGIVERSILIKVDEDDRKILTITGFVNKSFRRVFKRKEIIINGVLPVPVIPGTIITNYSNGIFIVKLKKESNENL